MKYFAKVFKYKKKNSIMKKTIWGSFLCKKFGFLLIEPFHFAMLNIQSGVMKLWFGKKENLYKLFCWVAKFMFNSHLAFLMYQEPWLIPVVKFLALS